MRSKCFLCILVCGMYTTGFAQMATADSTLYRKAFATYTLAAKKPDSAMMLARDVLAAAEKKNDLPGKAMSLEAIGWIFQFRGHYDSAVHYLQKGYSLFSDMKSDAGKLNTSLELAELYNKQSKFNDALKAVVEADSISNKLGLKRKQADVKRMLAIIYRGMRDMTKAQLYFKEAMTGFLSIGDSTKYMHTSGSLAILYRSIGQYDSSLVLTKENLAISIQKSMTPYQVAMNHEGVADSYLGISRNKKDQQYYADSALRHYVEAYTIFKEMNDSTDLAWESSCIGSTLAEMKRFTEAEKYLQEAYDISKALKQLNNQYDIAGEFYKMYENAGDYKKAFTYLKLYYTLKDSVSSLKQLDLTNELKEKFETEKKEQEIKLLKAQNELTLADNRKTRLRQYIFILLFIASIAIGWLLLNRFKIKKALEAQLLRNQIAGDLHDDIGSALSSIDISSRIALAKKDDAGAIEAQLTKIGQQAKKTMDSMGDIVWSVNAQYDNFESVLSRMKEFAAEICEPKEIALQFDMPAKMEKLALDTTKRKNLFLVFKEAVNNAVKYSNCSAIDIRFSQTGKNLSLSIQDNGDGFDETTIKKGNGLRNMRSRADALHGQLTITAAPQKGTTVALVFPM